MATGRRNMMPAQMALTPKSKQGTLSRSLQKTLHLSRRVSSPAQHFTCSPSSHSPLTRSQACTIQGSDPCRRSIRDLPMVTPLSLRSGGPSALFWGQCQCSAPTASVTFQCWDCLFRHTLPHAGQPDSRSPPSPTASLDNRSPPPPTVSLDNRSPLSPTASMHNRSPLFPTASLLLPPPPPPPPPLPRARFPRALRT
jgi:hypothetical protein